ncbi:hypothetical protein Dimus_019715 [Dionaea muscipula]
MEEKPELRHGRGGRLSSSRSSCSGRSGRSGSSGRSCSSGSRSRSGRSSSSGRRVQRSGRRLVHHQLRTSLLEGWRNRSESKEGKGENCMEMTRRRKSSGETPSESSFL